ncbi:hypothetical protein BOTBODRAFT_446543 [Botryobasidium botryosum FD-172 SS1]|uniref:HAT C-terminal dimerisation domain-containing protein n=1 Tax=Botryobasidium botryosum (strain FD-172 SS1) TaxID=930990 RepID=A0A067MAR6_BOTB1|nr:hypothetical protein BOTBODRAFT_446543 [Botryobasidium botryosum FD-172 SS1]
MHQVLPAIEWLIQQWNKCLKDPVYRGFENSIEHALLKMEDYHRELRSQPAYIVSMVLNPRVKFKFIKKNWSDDDAAEAERTMKNIFRERFLELAKRAPAEHPPTAPSSSRKRAFCISDSEDSDADGPESSLQPWEREYTRYVNTKHELAKNSSAINWWGLQRATYPTWASLAFDYLPIMSSSVSSERSFSSGFTGHEACRPRAG